MSRARLHTLLTFVRPAHLLLTLLTYVLGLGVARYLGATLKGDLFALGLCIVVLVTASGGLWVEYFRPVFQPLVEAETPGQREELRRLLLVIGTALLATAAALVLLMGVSGGLNGLAQLALGGLILLVLANAVPPLRLVDRGFGELSLSIVIAYLTPALAYVLQTGEPHRLLNLVTFPLALLALAYFLLCNFPTYAEDLHFERRTLLIRLSWQRAIPLHNVLLVAAFILYALSPLLQVPTTLIWPALLTVPLAAYQIFMVRNIEAGVKPLWNVLLINGAAIFGLTAYLLTLTFWLH